MCINIVLLIILSTIIIGLPIYMVGCDEKFGGYCLGYHKNKATVIDNDCDLTHGYVSHGKTSGDDDGIGFNCNVHIKYIDHSGYNMTCPIYRSDGDKCNPLVKTWHQLKLCKAINQKDYPLGKDFIIYVSKVNGRCKTHHLVKKHAIIGFAFLISAGILIIIVSIICIYEQSEHKKNYMRTYNIQIV